MRTVYRPLGWGEAGVIVSQSDSNQKVMKFVYVQTSVVHRDGKSQPSEREKEHGALSVTHD